MIDRSRAPRRAPFVSRVAVALSFLLLADQSEAQEQSTAPSAEALDLRTAVEAALASHPELRAAEAAVRAGSARIDTAGLRPPLELTADVENAFGSGELSGLSGSEITVGIAQVFELGRKRLERISAATVEYRTLEREQEWRRLDIQANVTDTFVQALAVEQRLAIVDRARALADSIVAAAERRVNAGRSSQAELSRARVTVAQAQIERLTLDTERARLHRELARLMGRDPTFAMYRLGGSLEPLPSVPSPAALAALLQSAPDAQRAALNRDLATARLNLAQAHRRPDISFGAGVRSLQATDDIALVLSGSIPVGTARRARSGIAEARAELERADALAEANSRQLVAQAQGLAELLELARRELDLLRGVIVPESQRAEELVTRGYERGRFSFLEIADAQRQSIEAARAYSELTLRFHQTIIELGRLLGRPQPSEGQSP